MSVPTNGLGAWPQLGSAPPPDPFVEGIKRWGTLIERLALIAGGIQLKEFRKTLVTESESQKGRHQIIANKKK